MISLKASADALANESITRDDKDQIIGLSKLLMAV